MEASPAKLIHYFNGEKQNIIPLFQRPYSWKKANWQSLWDDMMVQYDHDAASAHFMGAIVSVPARSVPVGVSKFLIIDGQQRLTTISLLLCALRDVVGKNSSDRIQQVYLTNRFREAEDTLKLVPTQADRDRYADIVLDAKIIEDDSLMSQAYIFFKNQLQKAVDGNGEPVSVDRVLVTVEQSLQVVMINLADEDDPYLIFESLNFKGEPLTQADLVRNYLLMRFQHSVHSGGQQEAIYKKYWAPMESSLGNNLTEFLRHYAMKDGDNINQGGIYAATKMRLKGMGTTIEVEHEAAKMSSFAAIYQKILNPEIELRKNLRDIMGNIIDLEVRTSYPLLLRLFSAEQDNLMSADELEACLVLVESFAVRRAVCAVPTNALNKLFLQWSKNFPTDNFALWLHTAMSSGAGGRRFPTDSDFADAFTKQPQYGRGSTRFILCRLEKKFMHKEVVDLGSASIEHVMPQTLTADWIADLGDNWKEIYDRYLGTFGNLTLTGYNPELGNLSFTEKKEKLLNTHIELNRFILDSSSWGAKEICERGELLLAVAKEIWPGPITD